MKRWHIITRTQEHKNTRTKTEEIIKILLKNRGLKTKKQIKEFLHPPNPYKLKPKALGIKKRELDKAIKRIKEAIDKQESIVVYSDFDADGVCGAAILWETLYSLGAKVMPYIPDRIKEGYGLSKEGIDKVLKKYGASLIITVDQGITARKKIEYAKKKGIEVIITDHHVPPKKAPQALAIVHTTSLSGSGVAWVLAHKIRQIQVKPVTGCQDHLALVAIGTIADLVPLIGPARSLVKFGLEELNQTKRIGLNALFKEAGLEKGKIGTYEVGFIIAPRLNAMGRIVHAIDSLRLLCTQDRGRALNLARKLDQTNRERQRLMEEATEHAKNHLAMQPSNHATMKLIFLSHSSYHEGIIGLVAGKLVEEFYRPAIVVSKGETFSKASARSINGFNIVEAIRKCSDFLIDCGGHPLAAGFTVETKHLEKVKSKLEELAQRKIAQDLLTKTLKIDCEIALSDITFSLYQKLSQFAPFGIGNPEPVFASRGVRVLDARVVGSEGKHLKLLVSHCRPTIRGVPSGHLGGGTRVEDKRGGKDTSEVEGSPPRQTRQGRHLGGGKTISAIAFGMGHLYPKLSPEKPIDIAYTISVDQWNNQKRLQLKIKDIKIK